MDNRFKILSTAQSLFASHGYDAVGVQDIAEGSGITKPTLYHYFGSKKGVLESLLGDKNKQFLSSVKTSANYNGDLPMTLHRIVSAYFDFASNNPEFYRMQLSMTFSPVESEPSKTARPLFNEHVHILEDMFNNASKDHGNMRGRQKQYAVSLIGMINIYVQLWFSGEIELNSEVTFKALHQFMHGIYS